MNSCRTKVFSSFVLLCLLLSSLSCARESRLVSIQVTPAASTFEGFGAQGQFTAFGTFVHPPETRDITNQVIWKLDVGNFGDLTPTGQLTYTRTDGCGSGNITAIHSADPGSSSITGDIVVGSATVKGGNEGTETCR